MDGATELELADGRLLSILDHGDPDGALVVVHQTTPGGRPLAPEAVRDAREQGLRLVSYARPGYAASTRAPGRAVRDAASDCAQLADALGAQQFLTYGSSGGGPHALASAALLPDRVVAAASLAGVGPFDAPGLDFLAGMGEGNIEEFGIVVSGGEEATRAALAPQVAEMLGSDLDGMIEAMARFLTDVDAAEMRGWFGALLLAQSRDGCAGGVDGWVDDDLAFVAPWGFDVAEIRVPVLVLQGRHDAMVPYAHGEWLASRIPHAEARLSEEDGHLTLQSRRLPEVHAWLRSHWDAR